MSFLMLAVEYLFLSVIFESIREKEKDKTTTNLSSTSTCACNTNIPSLPVYESVKEWRPVTAETMNAIHNITA